jgi:hypothetical protein
MSETVQMMNIYAQFSEEFMALPVVKGKKPQANGLLVQMKLYVLKP